MLSAIAGCCCLGDAGAPGIGGACWSVPVVIEVRVETGDGLPVGGSLSGVDGFCDEDDGR